MAHDAIVIGAGPNGLVAANLLADEGWSVLVLEAQDEPGGAVRSAQHVRAGFEHDRFSAFYPLGAASPALRSLRLEEHGLRWRTSPAVVSHADAEGRAATLWREPERTAASVEAWAPGDGERWLEVLAEWRRVGPAFVAALLGPWPPVRAGARLARALGPDGAAEFARFGLLPVRRYAQERFGGEGAANLLAGNALHADVTPDAAGGALFGWLLCMLGQEVGFPVPEGGSGRLTDALVRRLESRGGAVRCGERVTGVEVRGTRARGVRCASGARHEARRAVLADVSAPALYGELLDPWMLPARAGRLLRRFQWDSGTVKVDWALRAPIPWSAQDARHAGTVHVTGGLDELTRVSADLASGRVPDPPFLILGQYAPVDPTRMPPGTDAVWAYTHVPNPLAHPGHAPWDAERLEALAARMEAEIERRAPGFGGLVAGRSIAGPAELQAADANLGGGALNAGTAQLHQQLVFRPAPGLMGPRTPVDGLWLAGASAHPGGGVHGACGANAARAALREATAAGRARALARSGSRRLRRG